MNNWWNVIWHGRSKVSGDEPLLPPQIQCWSVLALNPSLPGEKLAMSAWT